MCDKVVTVIVQAGLVTICVLGSPIWLTAAVLGAGPYAVYRVDRRRRARARENAQNSADRRRLQRRTGHLEFEEVGDHDPTDGVIYSE